MRRIGTRSAWTALAVIMTLSGRAGAQTPISGPTTFGTGLSVSNTGAVSVAPSQTGLTCSGCTLSGATTLPGGGAITSGGLLGIGTSSPAATLDVQTTWSASAPTNLSGSWTSYGDTSRFVIRGANGTQSAPSGILAGQTAGNINFRGYTSGGAWTNGVVNIEPVAEENYSATSDATGLSFGTTPTGSTGWQAHMYLSGAGDLGIGTSSPRYLIDVQGGQVNASGGFVAAGTTGVTCSGAPTAAFAVTSGIVTHC
jgi:hypothetical protein